MKTKSLLACALATAFALSSCAQPNEPAAAPASSASPEEAITAEATEGTEGSGAVYGENVALVLPDDVSATPADMQGAMTHIGHLYASSLVSNRYALSGEWVEDGQKGSDVAASYANFYSDKFKEILSNNSWEEIAEMGIKLPFMALGTTSANGEAVASKKCMEYQGNVNNYCSIHSGWSAVGGQLTDTIAFPAENRITFDYTSYVPIRIAKGQTGELPEGYTDAVFSFDLTFVPNEGAGPDELPYLIDWTVNEIKSAEERLLADDPTLTFYPDENA